MRQSKLTNKQQPPPAPRSFASMCMLDIRNSRGGGGKKNRRCWMLGKGSFVPTRSHAASLPFFSLHRFFVCICTHTTLKPGSRNSLGQPFHPSLSQFLVKHLLLLLQKGKIFPLAQVMRPLIHTPWFRQPFTSGLPNTHISHLQNSGDTLC